MLIELSNTAFGYRRQRVVQVETLLLQPGRCLGIFGPNGAGKTTLVRGLMGLLPPLAGQVRHAPTTKIGYVAQHRALELHWPMTGGDVASMGVSARRRFGWVNNASTAVQSAMKELSVDHLAGRPFASLSGGQQQRLIVAGALADTPNVLVLDEPTDGLDVHSRAGFLEVLRNRMAGGLSVALISHEIDDLIEIADEVAWLHPGAEVGEPSQVELVSPAELSRRLTNVRERMQT
jgi:ABC-type Mn2+/Zn2+ transport system ATPase subunit